MSDPEADYKWLVARERGEDVGHVIATERASYERLGELLGSGVAPSAGFRQRVLDAIDAAEAAERAAQPEAAAPAPAAEVVAVPTPVAAAEPAAPPEPAVTAEPAGKPERAPEVAPVVPLRPPKPEQPSRRPEQPSRRPEQPSRRPEQPSRKPWLWVAGGVMAAAAVLLLVVKVPSRRQSSPGTQQIALATEVRHGPAVLRGDADQASVGDTLVVRASATGPAELRVYGGSNARLIASCDERGGCTVERDGELRRFVLEVALTTPGTVRAVVFVGANLPPSARSLDPDLEAAAAPGAEIEVKQGTPVRVL